MAGVQGTPASVLPFQSRGFETSMDAVRRQAYQVAPVAGYKRPSSEQPADAFKSLALHAPNGSEEILESPSLEFARASLAPPANRFTASRIHPGPGATAPNDGQLRGQSAAPGSSQNPLLSLTNPKYGLPDTLTANFGAMGVNTIYAWQASCLLARGLLSGERHLVYTAPTGGGKSLVADVLLLKRIIENPTRKAILVLPYVALVQEKLKWMRRIVQDVEKNIPDDEKDDHESQFPRKRWRRPQKNIRVTGFFGGSRTTATWADTDIAICTIEKVRYKNLDISCVFLIHDFRPIP
jgi:hypothetical protein